MGTEEEVHIAAGSTHTLDDGITVKGEQVKVLNMLGAGDAFVSGLELITEAGQRYSHLVGHWESRG